MPCFHLAGQGSSHIIVPLTWHSCKQSHNDGIVDDDIVGCFGDSHSDPMVVELCGRGEWYGGTEICGITCIDSTCLWTESGQISSSIGGTDTSVGPHVGHSIDMDTRGGRGCQLGGPSRTRIMRKCCSYQYERTSHPTCGILSVSPFGWRLGSRRISFATTATIETYIGSFETDSGH
jgi:hypothetical protein